MSVQTPAHSLRVSVVIPTYNRAAVLPLAIESVLAQTCRDFEILIIDDGSDDAGATEAAVRPYVEAQGDRVRYIRRENGGVSAARNAGIENARGEWVAFLDDDDEFTPDKLNICLAGTDRHPQAEVVATNATILFKGDRRLNLFELRGFPDPGELALVDHPLMWAAHGCFFVQSLIVRRAALLDVGMFDPGLYFEDLHLVSKLALRTPWVVDRRELFILHRRDDTGTNLSYEWSTKPIKSYESLTCIYDELSSQPSLRPAEVALLRRTLAGYRYELGLAYLREGRKAEARDAFHQSIRDNPASKTLIKNVMALAFGRLGARAASLWNRRHERGVVKRSAQPSQRVSPSPVAIARAEEQVV